MIPKFIVLVCLTMITLSGLAQKKVLSTNDFAGWNRIENRIISNDGNYVCYELNKQKGDGCLIIYSIVDKVNDTIKLAKNAKFSPNSDYVAYNLYTPADTVRKLKLAKTPDDKLPKDSLAVYNLTTKNLYKYANVNSFKMAEEKSRWMAILVDYTKPKSDVNDTVKAAEKTGEKGKNKKNEVKNLILLNPLTGQELTFNRVEDYAIAYEGKTIAFTSKINDTAKVYALISFNTLLAKADTLIKDSLTFKKISIDRTGNQLAFLASADTIKEKVFSAYYANLNNPVPMKIIDTLTVGLPKKWAPSENGNLYFSDDATKLFLGTAQAPNAAKKDSTLAEEKPLVDVWSWTDSELQPMQLKNADKIKKQNYLAVYHIKNKTLKQLADTAIETVQLDHKNNSNWALGANDNPYKRATSWTGLRLKDYRLINVTTGEKQLQLQAKTNATLSPNGKFIVWYELTDSSYYSKNLKTGKTVPLTKNIPVSFFDELNDVPAAPSPYGIAGWAENDAYVFIYDRFDIWRIDMNKEGISTNITLNYGRKNNTELRYKKLDEELQTIPLKEIVILTATNETNFKEGFYSTTFDSPKTPTALIEGDFRLAGLTKAKFADKVIWSSETVSDYPEIKYSSLLFNDAATLSETNTQQKDFNWATVETVEWQSFSNESLKGLLYKPENFDPAQKYPMVVYFYERSTQNIHYHFIPSPSHSIINKTFYASNGYLVFVPDITYTTGYPGKDAYNAIVSGVNSLIATCPFVDAAKIGLQGQSWGGYQIAYLITQTNMFAAAMAGAPVSNMTSAYGGIRWESGMSRMFQYEQEQSRIGGTLWEKPLNYIENSPVFYAPQVNTPLLMMHNDNDGAVPWYQGIEYFVALRRLNKPVWLLNYNGMKHNIETKYWANRMDLSKRMMQYFDHYLKNKPAPEWMINGVPAIKKGEELGY